MKKTGWLLYESKDALKNRWYIEKIQNECMNWGLSLELVFTDYITDAYTMELKDIANNLIEQKNTPSFIINRSRHSSIAYELESRGIRIFNPARVSEISNDKDKSYQLINEIGLPFLPYSVINSDEFKAICRKDIGHSISDTPEFISIANKAKDFGYPFILKPSDGHGGMDVFYIDNIYTLHVAFQGICSNYHLRPYKKILFQKYAATPGKDLRVYVLDNQIVAGMLRRSSSSKDFRANFSLGANATIHTLTEEERHLTEQIIKAMPSDFIGIDFVYDKNDTPVFNEIEDAVGSRMIYANTDIDIIKEYARHISCFVE